MDFDNAKENIQPLASGRNVSLLQASLCQDASQELSAQRKQLELDIKNYKGDDPLEPWYNYILWIEQSYPAGGSNSGLQKVLGKCLALFEQDERYKQDRRLIKLIIKFMGSQGDQIECYQQMYNSGIGTMLADFYIAWAYSYDLSGNMRKANEIFKLGVDCRAEPLEDLKEAQQHYGYAACQRMLYTDATDVNQELEDRRLALRSLRGQKRKDTVTVGSVRTGAAVKSNLPGVVQSDAPSTSRGTGTGRNAHRQVQVFQDENADQNVPLPVVACETEEAAGGGEPKSGLRSIIDAARQQENLKEPIAWSKPHKHGKIFSGTEAHDPAFPIHVDEKRPPPITNYERNFDKPFKYVPNFVAKNKQQEPLITPVTIEDEPNSTALPCYEKCMTYPRPNKEFSPEEYRAFCWFKRRNAKHPYVLRHEEWWGNGAEFSVRLYPNFATCNKPQPIDETDGYQKMPEVPSLKPILDYLYDDEEQREYQTEERLAAKWFLERNNTVHGVMDMEETVCLPGGQMPRRKSFFPTPQSGAASSKSMIPRVSCVMEDDEEQGEEEEQQSDRGGIKIFEDPVLEKKQTNRGAVQVFEDPLPEKKQTNRGAIQVFEDPVPEKKQSSRGAIQIFEDPVLEKKQTNRGAIQIFEDPLPDEKQNKRSGNQIFKDPLPEEKQTNRGAVPKRVIAPHASSPAASSSSAATAAVSSPDSVLFAMPMPPAAPTPCKIEIYEDDTLPPLPPPAGSKLAVPAPSAFFDADETCSTQTFNIFLKSQAVSTPKAVQKQAPSRQFGTILKDVSPTAACAEEPNEPETTTPMAASVAQPVSPMLRKQLSTILETSEHGTHGSSGGTSNATTKSTLISTSTSPGSHVTTLTSKSETLQGECTPGPTRFQRQMISDLSVVGEESGGAAVAGNFERLQLWEANAPSVPMMKSLRFQEDKTETVTRPLMACYQEDKTETLPKLPMAVPDLSLANASKLYQPAVPTLPPSTPEMPKGSSVFTKTPAKPRAIDSPLFDGTSKRSCNQKTPDLFSKSSMQGGKMPVNDSLEMFDDVGYSLPVAQPTNSKPLTTMSKLADSFMTDLSFAAETHKPKAMPMASSRSATQKKFEIMLDDTMPPPPPLPVAMPAELDCTVPETQPQQLQVTIGPAHLTASFMKDCTELSHCPLQDAPPPVASKKFDVFLDDSLPEPPAPPPAIMDCTIPETQQPEVMAEKLETIGPAHLTASFMKDCTELSKGATNFKFSEPELEKSSKTDSKTQSNDYFELNAETEMFASNLSMIKNSTLLPEAAKKQGMAAAAPAPREELPVPSIVVDESHDEQCIYFKKTPVTPKLSHTSWQETSLTTPPRENYEHRKAGMDESLLNSTLAQTNVNPFSVDIINSLLDSIEFSQYIEKLPTCQLLGHVNRLTPHTTVSVNKEEFEVQKILGKGAYGTVFNGVHRNTGKKVVLKQEKPTNYWEYYICLEVHSRLANEDMIAAFMHIDYALVGNNSSVYISELSEYGSLINVCNKFKKHTNKNMDEYVVMMICCQLLDIVDHLHALGIIHADIKADNLLLMKPLSTQPNELCLQLIDFGVAIDTKLFPPNQTFDYVHNDETFKCIEMRTGRRWTYQLDLFGLVGVMHVLLFGRYMEVTQRQPGGIWMPKQAFPRYFNRQAWESVFRTLLNVKDCRSMPNLQELKTLLKLELAEKEKYVDAAIAKFNLVMQRK